MPPPGRQVRRFDDHTQTVTGISWIDDERVLSASTDATLRVSRLDDAVSSIVVETIAAAGMVVRAGEADRADLVGARRAARLVPGGDPGPALGQGPAVPERRRVLHPARRLAPWPACSRWSTPDRPNSSWSTAGTGCDSAPPATTTYANAKVLLLGDSGVGKSGLAMVLAGEEFKPTDSTHGRRIWRLQAADPAADEQESSGDSREVMLWDLAGQPGYRIVHQLHLEGAALALILFDAKSETTPLGRSTALGARGSARPSGGGGRAAHLPGRGPGRPGRHQRF